MNETLDAILTGIVLVPLSLLCGAIVYALIRERVKQNQNGNE